jgi:predicted O-methyltransferase YrrM
MLDSSLFTPLVSDALERLHNAARGDWKHRIHLAPRYLLSTLTGHDWMPTDPSSLHHMFASVTREQGMLLYQMARANRARCSVEFGSSFGISTTYLAAAARDTGGRVITTEILPHKAAATRANLREAGLENVVTVLEGDARETLRNLDSPVDLLFLDGMKHLYLPVFELLRERLQDGAVLIADNVNMPSARPYLERVRGRATGFASSTLFGGRMEISYLRPGTDAPG